jgi:hypothetical protein
MDASFFLIYWNTYSCSAILLSSLVLVSLYSFCSWEAFSLSYSRSPWNESSSSSSICMGSSSRSESTSLTYTSVSVDLLSFFVSSRLTWKIGLIWDFPTSLYYKALPVSLSDPNNFLVAYFILYPYFVSFSTETPLSRNFFIKYKSLVPISKPMNDYPISLFWSCSFYPL